jgi:hypothetical protein
MAMTTTWWHWQTPCAKVAKRPGLSVLWPLDFRTPPGVP